MAAIGVDMETLRPPPLCLERDGVGVASEAANRDRWAGGVANADGVVERRRRLRPELSPGEEKVLPIGLEKESSGDEGPAGLTWSGIRKSKMKFQNSLEGTIRTVVEICWRRIGSHDGDLR